MIAMEVSLRLSRLALIYMLLAFAVGPTTAGELVNENGWDRSGLINTINSMWGTAPVDAKLLEGTPEQRCMATPDDHAWLLEVGPNSVSGRATQFTLIGSTDRVHTVRIFFPVVSIGREEVVQSITVLNETFHAMVPEWSGAATWTEVSAHRSWQVVAELMAQGKGDRQKAYVRHTVGAVRLITFGVPPDFVTYMISILLYCDLMPADQNTHSAND